MSTEKFIEWCITNSISFTLINKDELKINAIPGALTPETIEQLKERKLEIIDWLNKQTLASTKQLDYFEKPIPDNCQEITAEMFRLVELDDSDIIKIVASVPRGVENIKNIYPLSPLQEGMMFHHKLNELEDPYVSPTSMVLSDKAAFEKFVDAMTYVVSRHDALRSLILWRQFDTPVQVVCKSNVLAIEKIEFEAGTDISLKMSSLTQKKFHYIDLEKLPLIKIHYAVEPSTGKHHVFFLQHHLFVDHISFEVIYQELYAYMSGHKDALEEPTQYCQFIAKVQEQLKGTNQTTFFSKYLADFKQPTQLFGTQSFDTQSFDTETADESSNLHQESKTLLSKQTCKQLREISVLQKVSPAAIFHAALAILSYNHTHQSSPCFGTVLLGRMQDGEYLENMVGMTINTLPFRIELKNVSGLDLIKQSNEILLQLIEFDFLPLSSIKGQVDIRQDMPLFDTILNYRHTESESIEQVDNLLGIEKLEGTDKTNFPLSISVDDLGELFEVSAKLNVHDCPKSIELKNISPKSIIAQLSQILSVLIDVVRDSSVKPILEHQFISKSEIKQQLLDWNQTSQPLPDVACIHELFEAEVNNQPDSIAVSYQGTSLTYSALNAKANQLAHYLTTHHGVEHGNLVGLCLSKNLNTLVAILAVLKAGAAYVPLLSDYPAERMSYVIDDTKMKLMICDHTSEIKLSALAKLQLINIESEVVIQAVEQSLEHNLADAAQADSLAYVIYTSGSTGQPKGVLIEHKGAVNLAANLRRDILGEHQSWGWNVSYAFDGSVKGLLAMASGCRLVVIPDEIKLSGREFIAYLKQESVELVDSTPSMFKALSDDEFTANEIGHFSWILGGESLSHSAWESIAKAVSLTGKRAFNAYGPTEGTVNATWTEIKADQQPHIGKPLGNVEVVVMQQGQLVPTGAIGELYLGGMGIARGYLNQDTLTAKSFIDNPYRKEGMRSERLYRTGDLVKWQSDGSLVFVGRNDDQVKIRGYRIELGEIESKLLQVEGIEQAVVVSQKDHTGEQVLVGYYCANEKLSAQEIKGKLETSLPSFMVPTVLQSVDEFTLTSNGKIDKSCLPKAAVNQVELEYIAPTTDMERELCEIWQEVLNIEKVGIKDNFFLLGGHSLLLTRMTAQIRKQIGIHVDLKQVYGHPDVKALTVLVESQLKQQSENTSYINEMESKRNKSEIKETGVL